MTTIMKRAFEGKKEYKRRVVTLMVMKFEMWQKEEGKQCDEKEPQNM